MMKAWEAWKETDEFKNCRHWALRVTPLIQAADAEAEEKTHDLMPLKLREHHVEGSMWLAFSKGWEAKAP
jgi:hypothetical protein